MSRFPHARVASAVALPAVAAATFAATAPDNGAARTAAATLVVIRSHDLCIARRHASGARRPLTVRASCKDGHGSATLTPRTVRVWR